MAPASRSFPLSLNTSKSVDVPSVPSVGGRVVHLFHVADGEQIYDGPEVHSVGIRVVHPFSVVVEKHAEKKPIQLYERLCGLVGFYIPRA